MGGGSWDPGKWSNFASSTVGKSTQQLYTSNTAKEDLLPKDAKGLCKLRESRDSDDNPNSTGIIVDIDVTGSMGILADALARKGLGTLFTEVHERKLVSNPHLMFMANGDARSDQFPLQISQYEADIRIVGQLTSIFIEGNGGGNAGESYDLPWFFAANHTSIDCFEKRKKKGYLFTVGDEPAPPGLTRQQIKAVLGDDVEADWSAEDSLRAAQRMYEVFHLIVEEGGGSRYSNTLDSWRKLLNERALPLADHTKMSEVIVSTIQVIEGLATVDQVADTWSGDTSLVVHRAVKGLVARGGGITSGVTRF